MVGNCLDSEDERAIAFRLRACGQMCLHVNAPMSAQLRLDCAHVVKCAYM